MINKYFKEGNVDYYYFTKINSNYNNDYIITMIKKDYFYDNKKWMGIDFYLSKKGGRIMLFMLGITEDYDGIENMAITNKKIDECLKEIENSKIAYKNLSDCERQLIYIK